MCSPIPVAASPIRTCASAAEYCALITSFCVRNDSTFVCSVRSPSISFCCCASSCWPCCMIPSSCACTAVLRVSASRARSSRPACSACRAWPSSFSTCCCMPVYCSSSRFFAVVTSAMPALHVLELAQLLLVGVVERLVRVLGAVERLRELRLEDQWSDVPSGRASVVSLLAVGCTVSLTAWTSSTPALEDYVERMTSPHDDLLAELSEETRGTLGMEQMLTGPVAGRFLELLVWFGQPQRVLEIGTFSGHSALAMAAALPEGGRIDACELDPERAAFAQRYFDRSPVRLADHAPCRAGARDDRPARGRLRPRLHRRRQGRLRRLLRGRPPAPLRARPDRRRQHARRRPGRRRSSRRSRGSTSTSPPIRARSRCC